MKTVEIMRLGFDLQKYIDDDGCHLYLWTTNNFLPDALEVMEHWGFEYKTMITWVKDSFGLGQYFRGKTEHVLFGVRGSQPYKVIDGKRSQGKTAIFAPRIKHSEKPEEMRKMIESVSYGSYLELFARQKTKNWDVWGNEVENDISLEVDY
jgi:N6-adenosine-specific RNA methylase IME4